MPYLDSVLSTNIVFCEASTIVSLLDNISFIKILMLIELIEIFNNEIYFNNNICYLSVLVLETR